ncbi:unnamed protein product [Protopolystoma xenopodis]|uniref:Uncharacterized protein n=1 Tax=Protopolystoma xenopodis TaxID=117903 RepID=A0A3S5AE78_9PLAT|nr:unnamed protein product [Protopolystoma xenopodis]
MIMSRQLTVDNITELIESTIKASTMERFREQSGLLTVRLDDLTQVRGSFNLPEFLVEASRITQQLGSLDSLDPSRLHVPSDLEQQVVQLSQSAQAIVDTLNRTVIYRGNQACDAFNTIKENVAAADLALQEARVAMEKSSNTIIDDASSWQDLLVRLNGKRKTLKEELNQQVGLVSSAGVTTSKAHDRLVEAGDRMKTMQATSKKSLADSKKVSASGAQTLVFCLLF